MMDLSHGPGVGGAGGGVWQATSSAPPDAGPDVQRTLHMAAGEPLRYSKACKQWDA